MIKRLLGGVAVVSVGLLAVSAASAQIYEQTYTVEAVITPLAGDQEPITVSEVWNTVVYRDITRFHTVVRVFGEALHFEFEGQDHFLLKRGANNSSAGAYDPLRECLGISSLADYQGAPELEDDCRITARTMMVVKADEEGRIERLSRESSKDPYPGFSVEFWVRPTDEEPSYDLATEFPWIADLPERESSSLPVKIPEEGRFSMSKHYQKDFVVEPLFRSPLLPSSRVESKPSSCNKTTSGPGR